MSTDARRIGEDTGQCRERLIEVIRERSFQFGTEIKLASGRTSQLYFNMKPTMMHPEGAFLIASLVLDAVKDDRLDFIGGLEMGAVPLAASFAAMSYASGHPVQSFFVRKQAKEHGTQSLIEGLAPGEQLAGKRIAILEDVTTTGGSAMKAAVALRDQGAEITRVVTIVDRQEGASETFAAADLTFTSILCAGDFV